MNNILEAMEKYKEVKVVYPRDEEPKDSEEAYKIFLAGTIDNGESEDWQRKFVENYISENPVTYIYNPRRNNWDPTLADEFEYQINWELEHLERADKIIMNILGSSKSPISLMELGLFARTGKLEVYCPKEFYRYNNVKAVCERYGVKLYDYNI